MVPSPNLKYDQRYYFQVLPVENNFGVATLPVVRTFTTLLNVNTEIKPLSDISVYPNPANTVLFVKDAVGINKAEIISLVGNIVMTQSNFNTTRGEAGIDVSQLPAGMYFLRLTGNGKEVTSRFVISR